MAYNKSNRNEKEYIYECIKKIGIIGDETKRHKEVELGRYTVDGEIGSMKLYVWDHYFNRDGEMVRSNKKSEAVSMELVDFILKNMKDEEVNIDE